MGMKSTWKSMLRKSLPPTLLAKMQYAVFGLGDSGYVQFNVVAKKLDRRLHQLGGERLIDMGLGDDQVRPDIHSKNIPPDIDLCRSLQPNSKCTELSTACTANNIVHYARYCGA
jgi:sulfite reductase alpha subunit-like flavoprotein